MELEKLLQQSEQRKAEALENIKKAENLEELDIAELALRKANIDIESIKRQMEQNNLPPESRKAQQQTEQKTFTPLATYANTENEQDIYNTM